MDAEQTIEHIKKKYNLIIDERTVYPIPLPMGKHYCLPTMFAELGFTKGAEVGVYKAMFSIELMKGIPNLHLIGVDLWKIYPGYKDFGSNDIDEAYKISKEIYDSYGDRAVLLKGDSVDLAKTIPDGSLDFVFIDANHNYEHVVADIAAWAPKVRKGGIVSGHDYNDYAMRIKWASMHVVDAVNGWTRSYRIKPWFITTQNRNNCWFYVKTWK